MHNFQYLKNNLSVACLLPLKPKGFLSCLPNVNFISVYPYSLIKGILADLDKINKEIGFWWKQIASQDQVSELDIVGNLAINNEA